MYWICFGDSAKGALMCAKSGIDAEMTSERIISLYDDYSQGDISNPENREARMEIFAPWREDPELDSEWLEDYVNRHFAALGRLDEVDEAVIWCCGTSPFEQCGFRYVISRLSGRGAAAWLVKVDEMLREENAGSSVLIRYHGTGELDKDEAKYFYDNRRRLNERECAELSEEWQRLQKENSQLRVIADGILQSVPADFYDGIIQECAPEQEETAALTVGRALLSVYEHTGNFIGDMLVFGRIRALAAAGRIEIVTDAPDYRHMRIRKTGD